MTDHENEPRTERIDDDDEPLPPLPLDPERSFAPGRWWVVFVVVLVLGAFRLLIRVANDDRAAEQRPATTMVIDDPGAGLSPEEREALDEAIRRGQPLQLDSDGRLRPAD